MLKFFLILCVVAHIQSKLIDIADWVCIPIFENELRAGVVWRQQNCTVNETLSSPSNSLVVNSIHIDVSRGDLRVVPAISTPDLQSLPDIAAQNQNFIAGINGGYFWRVDMDGFWRDNVCKGKVRKEAEQEANPLFPNFGIGDGIIKVDGKTLASNCNCSGYSRPAVLQLGDPSKASASLAAISVLQRGEAAGRDPLLPHAIGAGPNLVSFDADTQTAFVDIPSDDDNINRLVYEATTAVGLKQVLDIDSGKMKTQEITFVTTDGSDSCMPAERFCGLEAANLATLMKDVFHSTQAMSMDQGGSTTMWVKGVNPEREGVISRSDNKQPESSEGAGRHLANGLFVEVLSV